MSDPIRRHKEGGATTAHQRSESSDLFPGLGARKTAPPHHLAWRDVYSAQAVARLDPELANEILEEVARDSWRRS